MFATKGMVATSQPAAAQAGLEILKSGGNAIDAAIATAACLTVVEPTSNGIGSDAFAIVWTEGKLHGLNSSGKSPVAISADKLKDRGIKAIPKYGVIPVTVPGAPAAWAELSRRFGRLPLSEVLRPAVEYAREGFAVTETVAKNWVRGFRKYRSECDGLMFNPWFDTFTKDDHVPEIGEIWKLPDHADTLKSIGATMGESFYRGEYAHRIDEFFRENGGYLRFEDMAAHTPLWVEPVSVNYRGYDVWELPPNGQGMVALMALNILKGFSFKSKESSNAYHRQIEAVKLAFADGMKYITDIDKMEVPVKRMLSDEYASSRRALIGDDARLPEAGDPMSGGTVYLATADGEGNMVSFIQSNYMGFGSGIVIPNTGIAMQNRGHTFSLNPDDANYLEPGKRTYHTIIPGFLTKDGQAVGPFGVMGGYMQPQGHVQVIMNMIDFGLNPQESLDAPRWQWIAGNRIEVEKGFEDYIIQDLKYRGHEIAIQPEESGFGRGQIIFRNDSGALCGGTERRCDGHIAIW